MVLQLDRQNITVSFLPITIIAIIFLSFPSSGQGKRLNKCTYLINRERQGHFLGHIQIKKKEEERITLALWIV